MTEETGKTGLPTDARELYRMAKQSYGVEELQDIIDQCRSLFPVTDDELTRGILNDTVSAAQHTLQEALRVREIWEQLYSLTEDEREELQSRPFMFEVHQRCAGWENVHVSLNGESHFCNVSDVGHTVSEFLIFAENLKNGAFGEFWWCSEPMSIRYRWYIARRDPWLYAEMPGAFHGSFIPRKKFIRKIRKALEPEGQE